MGERGEAGVVAVLRPRRGEREERLVDGVDLDVGAERVEAVHDAAGEVGVELVVRAEHLHAVRLKLLADLEERGAHGDAERLHLLGAGDDAAVVVGEHGDWRVFEVGAEEALAGDVEVRAVDEAEEAAGGVAEHGGEVGAGRGTGRGTARGVSAPVSCCSGGEVGASVF